MFFFLLCVLLPATVPYVSVCCRISDKLDRHITPALVQQAGGEDQCDSVPVQALSTFKIVGKM